MDANPLAAAAAAAALICPSIVTARSGGHQNPNTKPKDPPPRPAPPRPPAPRSSFARLGWTEFGPFLSLPLSRSSLPLSSGFGRRGLNPGRARAVSFTRSPFFLLSPHRRRPPSNVAPVRSAFEGFREFEGMKVF
ncbi:hypothetical protein NL676_018151 [Syzygium grande]|nr:hypothetical protein NL676_018151 [Syzygium grande]